MISVIIPVYNTAQYLPRCLDSIIANDYQKLEIICIKRLPIGELLGGVTLITFVLNIPVYLEAGVKAKISHGQTTITVTADEVKDSELDSEN